MAFEHGYLTVTATVLRDERTAKEGKWQQRMLQSCYKETPLVAFFTTSRKLTQNKCAINFHGKTRKELEAKVAPSKVKWERRKCCFLLQVLPLEGKK